MVCETRFILRNGRRIFLPMLTKKWFIALLIWEGSLILFFPTSRDSGISEG